MAITLELRRDAKRLTPGIGHWIRRRRISKIAGPPDPATLGRLCDHRGETLAWGLYSPESDICLRVISQGQAQPPSDWLETRLATALAGRRALGFGETTTGYREVNSEGDGLPGLVIDRYGAIRIVQITTAPMDCLAPRICAWLRDTEGGEVITLRPEVAARREGFAPGIDPSPPETLRYLEAGLAIETPAPPAQKTGAYHDQRDNRIRLATLARHISGPLLDLGCHVGGFSLHAASLGLECVAVDRSRAALAYGARNATSNGLNAIRWVEADLFAPLDLPELRGPFGTIVFDPPRMVQNPRDLPRARTALVRATAQLLPRVLPGGLLALCSCSHHLNGDVLDDVIVRATSQTDRHGQPPSHWCRVACWGPGLDHPTALGHGEGTYLRVHVYQRRDTASAEA